MKGVVENYEFQAMQTFHHHSMYFLKYNKEYSLVHPVSIRLTKFSFNCFEISKIDVNELNKMMFRMHPDIPLVNDQIWLNQKHCVFYNALGEQTYPSKLADKKWMIRIKLMGYKTDQTDHYAPIWTLIVAQDVHSRLSDCGDAECLH